MSNSTYPHFVIFTHTGKSKHFLLVYKNKKGDCVSSSSKDMTKPFVSGKSEDVLYNTLVEKVLHKFEPPTPPRKEVMRIIHENFQGSRMTCINHVYREDCCYVVEDVLEGNLVFRTELPLTLRLEEMSDSEYAPILKMLRKSNRKESHEPIQMKEKSSAIKVEHTKPSVANIWTRHVQTIVGCHSITSSFTKRSDGTCTLTDSYDGVVFHSGILKEQVPPDPSYFYLQELARTAVREDAAWLAGWISLWECRTSPI